MGQVIPFIARVRDSGDWTDAERARLEELADRLSGAGIRVDVAFGTTDEGDPWCAVTDETGDVLIHVARIGGTFVVHSAFDDSLNEAADLHDALREQLETAEDWAAPAPSAEILPFEARRAQTFLALVAAAAFLYEAASPAPAHAEDASPPTLAAHDPIAPPDVPGEETRDVVQQSVAASQTSPAEEHASASLAPQAAPVEVVHDDLPPQAAETAPPPVPEPAPTPVEAPAVIVLTAPEPPSPRIEGTDGDDSLAGATESEVILGGAGNDTLDGCGGQDTLDGGAGDDTIYVRTDAVAIGGSGADSFMVVRPVAFGPPDQLLGRIFDFSIEEGDRVTNWLGEHVTLPPPVDGATGPGMDHGFVFSTSTTTRVDVDLDGDGETDGYLLFGGPRPPPPPEPAPPDGDTTITVVGLALPWHEPGT